MGSTVSAERRRSGREPALISFPSSRARPALNALYLDARARGFHVLDAADLDELRELLRAAGHGDVIHVHRASAAFRTVLSVREARAELLSTRSALRGAVRRGALLIWTMLDDGAPGALPSLEQEWVRTLAESAHRIHLIAPPEDEAAASLLVAGRPIPDAMVAQVPIALLLGVYGAPEDQREARAALGVPADALSVLVFGGVAEVERLASVAKAVSAVAAERPAVLLVAQDRLELPGLSPEAVAAVLGPDVVAFVSSGGVADHEVSRWFSAADVVVAIGSDDVDPLAVDVAGGMGVPCIVHDGPMMRRRFPESGWVVFGDLDGDGLAALLRDWDPVDPARRRAAHEAATAFTPVQMSRAFSELFLTA